MADIIKVFKYNFTGAAAIAASCVVPTEGQHREIVSLTLHFSADPGVENLTITLNNVNGAAYDTLFVTKAMSGVTNWVWYPEGETILQPGDSLDIAQANATLKTYGIEVTMKEVS